MDIRMDYCLCSRLKHCYIMGGNHHEKLIRALRQKMSTSGRRKLLIDTDAGVDDAQAILMALMCPNVDVIGITCVAGNADAMQVGKNVLRVLQVVNRLDTSDYHGSDGFGDVPDPEAPHESLIQSEHTVHALLRLSKQYEGELSLVCLAPLTNIAMAIRMDPGIGSRLKHCYIMGGNHHGKGNMTVAAEFNFYFDPEAAYVVLNQPKAPITIVTWETCMERSIPWTAVGKFVSMLEENVIKSFYQTLRDSGIDKNYEVVDQFAMAAAIFDDVIMSHELVYSTVELTSGLCRGQMVVDWSNVSKRNPNVTVVFYSNIRDKGGDVCNFLSKIEKKSCEYANKQKWATFMPADEYLTACVLRPDVIKTCCDVYATVEVKGHYTWGQMVVDWQKVLERPNNVCVVTNINQDIFEGMLSDLFINKDTHRRT
ncbi:IUNH-like protein [Mya arenaria]|uniref:IUNH-like protein n=1 Tax=Mya arenaria TaxID=6604 RepID=A0ABY7G7J4_MYAAR|nr:IUNH-like protein [Mya arenaria]